MVNLKAQIAETKAQFDAETRDHVMTVLHDCDPPYRHVRFARPGTSIWSWSLTTWPGHLAVTGDIESFVFRREPDMFGFFAGSFLPDYWAEKVIAGKVRVPWDESTYLAYVEDQYREWCWDAALRPRDRAFLREAIDEGLLPPPDDSSEAHWMLNRFTVSTGGRRFEFTDSWEADFSAYNHHYLLACHAVSYGVSEYKRARS